MTIQNDKNKLSPKQLIALLEEETSPTLVDLLPPDHFENQHIPGAKNACVFFVSFLDDLETIVPNKKGRVVLYGSSSRSHETKVAVEKMTRAGYQEIYQLEGGLEAWCEAGFVCEGESDQVDDPQVSASLPNSTFTIDTNRSTIEWTGRNPNSRHIGTVEIYEGVITSKEGSFSGTIEIDMNSIHNVNLEGDELQPVLEAHLKSDDFFFTSMFPKATLKIEEAVPIEHGSQTTPNFLVKGELSLRGVSASLDFDATVSLADENALLLEAHFDIDKTRWNVIYGSSRFFEHLGMHKVFDLISLQLNIIAAP